MDTFEVIIFTDNNKLEESFRSVKSKFGWNVITHPIDYLYRETLHLPAQSFYYLDITGFDRKKFISLLKQIKRKKIKNWGIIDPESIIIDPARVLSHGAFDYINRELLSKGINHQRLTRLKNRVSDKLRLKESSGKIEPKIIPTPNSWEGIQIGKEYTFWLMFIEIDNQEKIKSKLGDHQLELAYNSFYNFLEKTIAGIDGRIWIWNNGGGVIIFPFSGGIFSPIITGMRLILSRKLISIEHLYFGFTISYRIVFHLGNTIYMPRGKTGTIVSDDINSLFHIGKRFAKNGKLYITERLLDYIPKGIKEKLVLCGESENLSIYQLEI